MALDLDDLPTVQRTTIGYFRNRLSDWGLGPRSFLGGIARSVALALYTLLRAVKQVDNDIVPTDATSTAGLDDHANSLGLDDGNGGYGRRDATAAAGGAALCTGVNGTTFTDGLILTASDGVTKVVLDGTVTITVGTSVAGVFAAQTTGTAGNLDVGEVLTWDSPPVGADASVTLTTALAGGLDEETNRELLTRIQNRLRLPPKGGAEPDYKTWAESVNGITAYVYPHRQGLGTVDVVITTTGASGAGRIPSTDTRAEVEDAISDERPVCLEAITVYRAYEASGLTIRARVEPSADEFAFEWVDTAATYTVDTYTAGSPATLKLNTLAPASLKAAIDAGSEPRIQVLATAGPAVPVQVRCTAYVDGGGKTTLTLEDPLPDGFEAPVATNRVFAGGPIATTIADEILDYIDSLGPSRVSETGATTEVWDDSIRVYQLARIALNVEDDDGTKLAKDLVSAPTINNVALDVQGVDHASNGPELLFAAHVVVTQ
jgi:uncharacterized phage protein gp47/JayE